MTVYFWPRCPEAALLHLGHQWYVEICTCARCCGGEVVLWGASGAQLRRTAAHEPLPLALRLRHVWSHECSTLSSGVTISDNPQLTGSCSSSSGQDEHVFDTLEPGAPKATQGGLTCYAELS